MTHLSDDERTKYYLVDIETGSQFNSFERDQEVISPLPPKVGEYLNQSGLYFEVLTLLQHFDSNYVDVYVRYVGDSAKFLDHIQTKLASKS